MQDDIVELEEEPRTKDIVLNSVDLFRKVSKERLKILTDLKFRLKEYNDYIVSYSQIGSRKRAERKDRESLDKRVYSYKGVIDEEETKYLIYYSDLLYVVPKPDSLMRGSFSAPAPQIKMKRFRASIDEEKQDGDENIKIWKEEKVEKFFTRTILIIGLLMLVGPL